MRITPNNIIKLNPYEVFVFGSNLSGWHGAGAARLANEKFGAIYGNGIGLMGNSYAIPTKSKGVKRTLTVQEIKPFVDEFIVFAKHWNEPIFLVTEIGCGLAGHKHSDIAPLFKKAVDIKNIHLPKLFWDILI